ncbi:glycoside hydrolase family 5 protein [Melanogaster broomeanus]|nr:glycoside hydrolase family 5 protein [Melanogaster broomeanus]
MKLSATLVSLALAAVPIAGSAGQSTGFVTANGQGFTLDGEPYTVFGSNSYWVGLMGYTTDEMNTAFQNIAATGATAVRTWSVTALSNLTPPGLQRALDGSTPTINYGTTGLQNFGPVYPHLQQFANGSSCWSSLPDNVIAAAKANGIRLIISLTNNWSDYGGMDVYVNQILGTGQPHDYFYTDSKIIAAFQNYIKVWVERYTDEQTILAWELANEPRCTGSTNSVSSGTCTTTTITNWVKTMSAYIKSLDSNHLVAVGDEGWHNWPKSSDLSYNGSQGIDFEANLAIDTIDFGTFHLYPYTWSEQNPSAMDWGQEWIENHRSSQATYNKPVLMEEFGSGLTGVLHLASWLEFHRRTTPNDGYTIYPGTPIYSMEQNYAAQLKVRDA